MNGASMQGARRATLLSPALFAWFLAVAGATMAVLPLVRGHGAWAPATHIGTVPSVILFLCAAIVAGRWYVSGRLRAPLRKTLMVAVIVLPLVAFLGALSGPSTVGSRFGGSYGVLFATFTSALPSWASVALWAIGAFAGLLLALRMALMPPPRTADALTALNTGRVPPAAKPAASVNAATTAPVAEADPTKASDGGLFADVFEEAPPAIVPQSLPSTPSSTADGDMFATQDDDDSGTPTRLGMTYDLDAPAPTPVATHVVVEDMTTPAATTTTDADPGRREESVWHLPQPPRTDVGEIDVDDDSDLRIDDPMDEATALTPSDVEAIADGGEGVTESAALADTPTDADPMTDVGPILAEADAFTSEIDAAIAETTAATTIESVTVDETPTTAEISTDFSETSTTDDTAPTATVEVPLETPAATAFDEFAALEAEMVQPTPAADVVEESAPTSGVVESTPMIESLFGEAPVPSEPVRRVRRRIEQDWASWQDGPTRRRKPKSTEGDDAVTPATGAAFAAETPMTASETSATVDTPTESVDVASSETVVLPSEDVGFDTTTAAAATWESPAVATPETPAEIVETPSAPTEVSADAFDDLDDAEYEEEPVGGQLDFGFEPDAAYLGRALELAEQAGYASTGLFQAELGISFTTACNIIERLAADGFLGPLEPSGKRRVLTLGDASGEASAEA